MVPRRSRRAGSAISKEKRGTDGRSDNSSPEATQVSAPAKNPRSVEQWNQSGSDAPPSAGSHLLPEPKQLSAPVKKHPRLGLKAEEKNQPGGGPQSSDSCYLLSLPASVTGRLFPESRVVVGRRTCRQLRDELSPHVQNVLLVRKLAVEVTEGDLAVAFQMFSHTFVKLHWKGDSSVLLSAVSKPGLTKGLRALRIQGAGPGNIKELVIKCKSLEALALTRNKYEPAEENIFMEALRHCSRLTRLTVTHNVINARWTNVLSRLDVGSTGLTRLDLGDNGILGAGARRLSEILTRCKRLVHLELRRNTIMADGHHPALEALLRRCSCLTHLGLAQNAIEDASLEAFARGAPYCTSLTSLDLSFNAFADRGAGFLARSLPHLHRLAILDLSHSLHRYWQGGTGVGELAQALGGAESLTALDLSNTGIHEFTSTLLPIGGARRLARLRLEHNGFAPDGSNHLGALLGRLPALTHLHMPRNELRGSVSVLAGAVTGLVVLDLHESQLGVQGAAHLTRVLQDSRDTLSALDLSENDISGKGARSLADGLRGCTRLTRLVLALNKLGAEGGGKVARALATCPALAHLDLRGASLSNGGAVALAKAMRALTQLTHLDLRQNVISAAGLESLAPVLAPGSSLRHADLRMNWIAPARAEKLLLSKAVLM